MGALVFLILLAAPVLIGVPLWIATGGGRGRPQEARTRAETANGSSRGEPLAPGRHGSSPDLRSASDLRSAEARPQSALEALRGMVRESRR